MNSKTIPPEPVKRDNYHERLEELRAKPVKKPVDKTQTEREKMSETGSSAEMPRYRSHKVIHALKIHEIDVSVSDGDGSAIITPEKPYAPFNVDRKYMEKHKPEVGGYYVVYKDGYTSFSPAEAFESGYTLIG